jgi:hypothetical protein
MAITITQEPQAFTPSDNPIIFVFKQDEYVSGSPKYKVSFIVEVYAGGLIGTFEVFPEVNQSLYYYGKIDVSDKVRSFVSNHSVSQTINNTYKGWYEVGNSLEVYVKVFEKYTLVSTNDPAIQTGSAVTSNIINVFKGSLNRNEFKNWDYTKYKLGSAFPYFLTDENADLSGAFPGYSTTFQKNDTKILSWLDDYTVDYKVVVLYLTTGGIVTESTTIPSSVIGAVGAFRFNLSERLDNGWITQSTYDTCYSAFIYIQNNSTSTTISPLYVLNFSEVCFDKGSNILWLNKFGSYDNFRFTYNSRFKAKIESKSFSKRQGEWVGSTYNINSNTFGKIDYLKTITKQLELSSDWLDETTQNWLVQLYESPLVYLNEGTEVENVVITDSSYQLKQLEHDELFNEIINIEFTDYKSISL